MISSYADAAGYLGRKTDRPLSGRSTRLQRRDADTIAVRYHQTDVVTYHATAPTVLDSGGWRTSTTKARINEYTPALLYQGLGLWYLSGGWSTEGDRTERWRSLFEDGVSIDAHGKPSTLVDPATTEKAKRAIDRKVSKYIKGFMAHLASAGKLPEPSGGDCWPCMMRPADGDDASTHGDLMGISHYLSHFDEAYYVPSLLMNAMRERRFGSLPHVWQMSNSDLATGREPWAVRSALQAFFRVRKHALVLETTT